MKKKISKSQTTFRSHLDFSLEYNRVFLFFFFIEITVDQKVIEHVISIQGEYFGTNRICLSV